MKGSRKRQSGVKNKMSINLDAIRAKVSQLSGLNKGRKDILWKSEPGEYTVRLLPWKNNDGQPFKERWFYYNIGQGSILAPNQFGKNDPIQELINKLHASGKKDDKELAKKLYPKMRAFAPVIVRGQEEKGVMLWSMSKGVYARLLEFFLDSDIGDITDPKEGFDLKVKILKQPGKMYADTVVDPARKQSKLAESDDKMTSLLNSVPDIDELYKLKNYDEIKRQLEGWLAGDSEQKDENPGIVKGGSSNSSDALDDLVNEVSVKAASKSQSKLPSAKKVSDNLDAAFDDLLSDD